MNAKYLFSFWLKALVRSAAFVAILAVAAMILYAYDYGSIDLQSDEFTASIMGGLWFSIAVVVPLSLVIVIVHIVESIWKK